MNTHLLHYAHSYLLNPQHAITVSLIGCGGTGSHVLQALAQMNQALLALGHPGLHVTAFDDKVVSPANRGRTSFSPFDEGENKAISLITRANRCYGTHWDGVPANYTLQTVEDGLVKIPVANITITCVDTIKGRQEVKKLLSPEMRRKLTKSCEPFLKALYWFDFGNLQKTGQALLSTIEEVVQPTENGVSVLPDIFEKYPSVAKQKDDRSIPSCTVAEALGKQGLCINPALAYQGMDILGTLFREGRINRPGLFLNLETGRSNPMPF